MSYWKRTYRINFPKLGYELSNGLQVNFDVMKDLTEKTNKSNVTIFNMAKANRDKVSQQDTEVEIYLGYEGTGEICVFKGTVVYAKTFREGNDVKTKLDLSDGQIAIRDCQLSLSFAKGTSKKTAVDAVAHDMGIAVEYGDGVQLGIFPAGFSFVGAGKDAMNSILGTEYTWSIQNNIMQVIAAGGVFVNKGYVFSASSGLVGAPERINESNPYEDEETAKRRQAQKNHTDRPQKRAGWKIQTLMTPSVNAGDKVGVDSDEISGWFRVESVHHKGDYIGGTWTSEFTLIEGLEDKEGDA